MKDPVGLRFVHPHIDATSITQAPDEQRGAPQLGIVTTPAGRLEWVQASHTVRQALRMLLSTRPGERVMRPEYGCDLHQLVFEPNDDTTAGVAMHHVRRAIERWEPRVEVLDLDATRNDEDAGVLEIVLEYRVRFLPDTEQLRWLVSVTGEEKL